MRWNRALVVLLGLLAVGSACLALYRYGPSAQWFPGCRFHRLTGLDCPGCGMTRATHAALHGRIGEAFRFNLVGMILFPAAIIGLGLELAGWVRGKPLPIRFRVGGRWAWGIFAVLMAFWVLRNIPVWPFILLAPP